MHPIRKKIFVIIFGADTPAGRAFDIGLIISVILSVLVVTLESVNSLKSQYDAIFYFLEWFFTILFSFELILRLVSVEKKSHYIFSFYGIVDIISVLPAYLTFFFPGLQSFAVIRALRILRIFRILKLKRYIMAGDTLTEALNQSKPKIIVFLGTVTTIVFVMGAVMYLVEGSENGFTSIPKGVYWAIVTMTTVGFGDVVPHTPLGQFISSLLMIMGYGVIAVPTGLVTADIVAHKMTNKDYTIACPECQKVGHEEQAKFCNHCGHEFKEDE